MFLIFVIFKRQINDVDDDDDYPKEPGFKVENYSKEPGAKVVSGCPLFFSLVVAESNVKHLEKFVNILIISGEMSLRKAWDQFWTVKGKK